MAIASSGWFCSARVRVAMHTQIPATTSYYFSMT